MEREELAAWLRLQLTPGVGDASARKLLTAFGLPPDIFSQTRASLAEVVSTTQSHALLSAPEGWAELTAATWTWLQEDPDARRVLALGDAAYPRTLLNMEDPPLLLYGMGNAVAWQQDVLNDPDNQLLAIVGSRNPTPQGAANARQFAVTLAANGLTIVSGMALGIDAAAHEGALEGAPAGRLATIAVVGTGLDRVYPRQHRVLAHRIAQHGMLLSEYPLGTPPLAANFPKRNRIIAGLARGTLVVEAALQSGSLITARMAAEQGSEVFAIPGSIHSTQARGCHALIKQGAKLVESAQDVLEEFDISTAQPAIDASGTAGPFGDVPGDVPGDETPDSALLHALGYDPASLDALQARTGLDTATLQAALMTLELEQRVVRLPGGLFQRMALA